MYRDCCSSDDIWDDLCDLHESNGCEAIAVLRAYVDASAKDSGLLTVAAYLFESSRVRRFQQRWRDTFGIEKFSWADLVARSKPFKHLRGHEHDAEHERLIKAGVTLVREHTLAGSIVSCWKQDVENYGPTWVAGFGHAYSVAGHMVMAGMGEMAKRHGYRGGIAYIVEAGDEGYDQLDVLMSYASKSADVADLYQWRGHSIVPKTPNAPFHAPDLFAWEWGKFMMETVIDPKRLMRWSFVNLIRARLDRHAYQHIGGEPLARFFKKIHELGVEQLQEDRAALASVPMMELGDAVESSAQKAHDADPG